MTYALTSMLFMTLALAGVAALLANVSRSLRGLTIPLTSDF